VIEERDRGNLDVIVEAPLAASDRHTSLFELGELSSDPNQYINAPFAKYYHLNSVTGRQP